MELIQILKNVDEWQPTPEQVSVLNYWRQHHEDIMDFPVFAEIVSQIRSEDEELPIIDKSEINTLLREEITAENCIDYADKKLGIQRGVQYWDGENCD